MAKLSQNEMKIVEIMTKRKSKPFNFEGLRSKLPKMAYCDVASGLKRLEERGLVVNDGMRLTKSTHIHKVMFRLDTQKTINYLST